MEADEYGVGIELQARKAPVLTVLMRFNVGEVYDRTDGSRTAVVTQILSEGREGLLRFTDTGSEEWFIWTELHQAGQWRRR